MSKFLSRLVSGKNHFAVMLIVYYGIALIAAGLFFALYQLGIFIQTLMTVLVALNCACRDGVFATALPLGEMGALRARAKAELL
jgi:hypothetical protein